MNPLPIELLHADTILAQLESTAMARIVAITVHDCLDSTNSYLMAKAAAGASTGSVCLAEYQTAGRGRYGRQWIASYGQNICLSLLWRFSLTPTQLSGLSLACGVAVAKALTEIGITDVGLKWPNDLLWQGQKLGGLLIEMRAEGLGFSYIVAGVGINLKLDVAAAAAIEQAWVDLAHIPTAHAYSRNGLAALLISRLSDTMAIFADNGLEPFLADWVRFDQFQGKLVTLTIGHRNVCGTYLGIDRVGALKLDVAGTTTHYAMGEVTFSRSLAG